VARVSPAPLVPTVRLAALVVGLWFVLLLLVLALPPLAGSPTPGMDLIRGTIRLSLLYFAAALNVLLWLEPSAWRERTPGVRLARWFWTLGWAAFLVHLGMAFHYFHGWSHADAVEHTRRVSGYGAGIYVSHSFTLLWTADVVLWWLRPAWYATRPSWVGGLLYGFMLFIVFNGTIVYEQGPIVWAGGVLFLELAAATVCRLVGGLPGASR
jgi:hypothetical protein